MPQIPMIAAQPKATLLIAEINAMVESGPNEDRIQAIEREISLIERGGFYAQAKQLEGMLAGLRKDEAGVRSKFRAALLSSGGDHIMRANFANALSNVRCILDAVAAIDTLCDEYPGDPDILQTAFTIHLTAYDHEGCYRLLQKIEDLGCSQCINSERREKLANIALALEGAEVSWTAVAERIELASKIVFEVGFAMPSVSEWISPKEILFEFGVIGSIDEVMRVETAILKKIASLPYSPIDSLLFFSCVPDEYPAN